MTDGHILCVASVPLAATGVVIFSFNVLFQPPYSPEPLAPAFLFLFPALVTAFLLRIAVALPVISPNLSMCALV